ncbi:MAG: alpha/beta fold hydrolase [Amaricoccus sp.]
MVEVTRRTMLGAGIAGGFAMAAAGGAGNAQTETAGDAPAGPPGGALGKPYFFQDPTFEFNFLIALGGAYYQAVNPGKLLWLTRQIPDGDNEAAYRALKAAGDEAMAIADGSAAKGHRVSARQAYAWAQTFYDVMAYVVDGSADPSRAPAVYDLFDGAWLKGIAQADPVPAQVAIRYEGTTLRGFHFRGNGTGAKRPLLIFNNGSDGSLLASMTFGSYGALARGYDVLTFDGPGQGYALWKQHLYFRPDWEKVITPVVDFALTLDGVDPKRIALIGISQGGYWVPRAVAFEKRIAVAVADPGVVDVSTSWLGQFPPEALALLKSGPKAAFDAMMAEEMPAQFKSALAFRMRPYGMASYFDVFTAVREYRLGHLVGEITCPMLVTDPDNEAFWPGQSQQLYDGLKSPKALVRFTVEEGADLHCEPKSPGLRDLRIFDWLDETLA